MGEKTGGPEFGLIINQAGVTDIGVEVEVMKEISAQDGCGTSETEKNKWGTFA